ncbi:MAG: DUF1931 domain-containing protein [Candidatus Woesearchaeota archaeon]|nr:MAG: DUF1931 domain-containing protein [Candidatus Woesearchaeota archaeon]
MSELLVVRSKVKEHVGSFNVSGDFADALSKEVEKIVQKAVERAKANGRKTVGARDI